MKELSWGAVIIDAEISVLRKPPAFSYQRHEQVSYYYSGKYAYDDTDHQSQGESLDRCGPYFIKDDRCYQRGYLGI